MEHLSSLHSLLADCSIPQPITLVCDKYKVVVYFKQSILYTTISSGTERLSSALVKLNIK